jgi:hypothetical protein
VSGPLDIETRVAAQRILEKGMEVDLHTTISTGDEPVWESLNTIYYRGRFGEVDAPLPSSCPPPTPTPAVARWRLPDGVGWRLARMIGDYNGIHHWHWYARRFSNAASALAGAMLSGEAEDWRAGIDRS